MRRLGAMGKAEWGILGAGLPVIGFGLAILLAHPHAAWQALAYVLMVAGLSMIVGAVVGQPAWARLSVAVFEAAQKQGKFPVINGPQPPRVTVEVAARFLSTELHTAKHSVQRLVSEGKFPRGVTLLPTRRWVEYEATIAEDQHLYPPVSIAYARAQEFNRMTVDRANLYVGRWLSFHDDDDIDGLVEALDVAIRALDCASGAPSKQEA